MSIKDVPVDGGTVVEIDANEIARIIAKHLQVEDIVTARWVARAANEIVDYLEGRVKAGIATRIEPGHA